MRRPKHPVPAELRNLSFNLKNGKYEISENGILYSLELEHTRLLKAYWKNENPSLSDWYSGLDKFTKKRILKIGEIQDKSDFFPDLSFD